MEILSWNTQAAKGVDNVTSVERIADVIKNFSDADVICLQEILRAPDCDQVAQLSAIFSDYTAIFGAATDRLHRAGRLQFGNLILCRVPVLQIVHHKLPQPADPQSMHMPRQASEILINYQDDPLRIVTTHLDYFASAQRSRQIAYLAEHFGESHNRFINPSPNAGEAQFKPIPETQHCLYCGDFNMTVSSKDYQTLTAMQSNNCQLSDCWPAVHGKIEHAPTCGIFDKVQWQEGPHCRDFFFASEKLVDNIIAMSVQTETAASDHQPLKITLR